MKFMASKRNTDSESSKRIIVRTQIDMYSNCFFDKEIMLIEEIKTFYKIGYLIP